MAACKVGKLVCRLCGISPCYLWRFRWARAFVSGRMEKFENETAICEWKFIDFSLVTTRLLFNHHLLLFYRFELRGLLSLWNTMLAMFSIMGAFRTAPELIHVLRNYGLFHSVCVPRWVWRLNLAIAMKSPDFQVIKRARDNEFDSHASCHRLIPLWTLEQSGCTTDKQSFSQKLLIFRNYGENFQLKSTKWFSLHKIWIQNSFWHARRDAIDRKRREEAEAGACSRKQRNFLWKFHLLLVQNRWEILLLTLTQQTIDKSFWVVLRERA